MDAKISMDQGIILRSVLFVVPGAVSWAQAVAENQAVRDVRNGKSIAAPSTSAGTRADMAAVWPDEDASGRRNACA
jgi:hypothetical protein